MNILFRGLFCAVMLGWTACTFQPDEEVFFKEVDDSLPEASINLNEYNTTDTIYLITDGHFQFDVRASKGRFLETKITLGGSVLFSGTNSSGTFIIGQKFQSGTYILRIKFLNSSGTGSLVDKLNAETVEIWKEWVVKIDKDPPPKPEMAFTEENGFLKISWTTYTKSNFLEYEIFTSGPGVYNRVVIKDPKKSYWIDSAYVGGNSAYYVLVRTNLHSSESAELIVRDPFEFTLTYRNEDSTAVLRWAKTKYFNALKAYEIAENNTIREVITDANTSSLDLKMNEVIMGGRSWVDFKIKRKLDEYEPFSEHIEIDNPLQLPTFNYALTLYASETQSLLGYGSGKLCNYNGLMEEERCRSIPQPNVPYAGDYVYYGSKPYVYSYNLETGVKDKVLIDDASVFNLSFFGGVAGGANQIVSYAYIDNTLRWNMRFHNIIYDMVEQRVIYESENEYVPGNYYFNYRISDDGVYVYHPNVARFYKIVEGNLELLFYSDYTMGSFRMFRPDKCNEAFFYDYSTQSFNIVDLTTQTIKKVISPPEEGYVFTNYDPVSKSMLFTGSRKIYIVNIETDEVVSFAVLANSIKLVNGILFAGNNYLKVFE